MAVPEGAVVKDNCCGCGGGRGCTAAAFVKFVGVTPGVDFAAQDCAVEPGLEGGYYPFGTQHPCAPADACYVKLPTTRYLRFIEKITRYYCSPLAEGGNGFCPGLNWVKTTIDYDPKFADVKATLIEDSCIGTRYEYSIDVTGAVTEETHDASGTDCSDIGLPVYPLCGDSPLWNGDGTYYKAVYTPDGVTYCDQPDGSGVTQSGDWVSHEIWLEDPWTQGEVEDLAAELASEPFEPHGTPTTIRLSAFDGTDCTEGPEVTFGRWTLEELATVPISGISRCNKLARSYQRGCPDGIYTAGRWFHDGGFEDMIAFPTGGSSEVVGSFSEPTGSDCPVTILAAKFWQGGVWTQPPSPPAVPCLGATDDCNRAFAQFGEYEKSAFVIISNAYPVADCDQAASANTCATGAGLTNFAPSGYGWSGVSRVDLVACGDPCPAP